MLTSVTAGDLTIRGISVGGVYTSLHISELGALLDAGVPPRSFAAVENIFLSHAHVDHAGALASLLGIRALSGVKRRPRLFLPSAIHAPMREALAALSSMQRWELAVAPVPMMPGSEFQLKSDLWVRAFRTFHPVPSLGYQFFRRVHKLRPEHADLPGHEIAERRRAGDDSLFYTAERLELAYATDTLARVLDAEPSILESRVLVLECTFLDERKSVAAAHAGCHIHLDEILERADRFANEHLVLMHFSQIYKPAEVVRILDARCPPPLRERIIPFVPDAPDWPG